MRLIHPAEFEAHGLQLLLQLLPLLLPINNINFNVMTNVMLLPKL